MRKINYFGIIFRAIVALVVIHQFFDSTTTWHAITISILFILLLISTFEIGKKKGKGKSISLNDFQQGSILKLKNALHEPIKDGKQTTMLNDGGIFETENGKEVFVCDLRISIYTDTPIDTEYTIGTTPDGKTKLNKN